MDLTFNINDDKSLLNKIFTKEDILSYVSQEEIFELVFGFIPVEYDVVCSPFRVDSSPGAYFEYYNDKMFFKDFGDPNTKHRDCFNAVKDYYKLTNFFYVTCFIRDHLLVGKKLTRRNPELKYVAKEKKRSDIIFQSRLYQIQDKVFWSRYDITKENLLEDKVLPVTRYKVLNGKNGDYSNFTNTLCYAYTEFVSGRKKLYFPYKKSKRFLTNCSKNDIGGLRSLDLQDSQLIITKSYKDWRVLKNQGYNSVWFQNEGMIPDDEYLIPLLDCFQDVIIFFDNDQTGISASLNLEQVIKKKININPYILTLPEPLLLDNISDASDLYFKRGKQELLNFLESNI
jgi:hypothetical protein